MAWGKFVGLILGFWLFKGWIGALIGFWIGHQWDKRREPPEMPSSDADTESIQNSFFDTTFMVLGHMAKIDGKISPQEIDFVEALMAQMELSGPRRERAQQLFRQGRDSLQADIDQQIAGFKRQCSARRRDLVQLFMELQIQMICADGQLSPVEDSRLRAIAGLLGFPVTQYQWLLGRVMAEMRSQRERASTDKVPPATKLAQAYQVLGLKSGATEAEVKRAYRKLMAQHHPDKLVAKGLPEDMVRLATEKAKEITAAYELIRSSRSSAA